MPVGGKWKGSQGGWESHPAVMQIWPCKERGKEERRKGRKREKGRKVGLRLQYSSKKILARLGWSLSQSRAVELSAVVACPSPWGGRDNSSLLLEWYPSAVWMGPWVGWDALVFLTCASQRGTSTLWASQKEEDSRTTWPVVSGIESSPYESVLGGGRESRPLGWTGQEQSFYTVELVGVRRAGSWLLPRRNWRIPVFWTTCMWGRASVTEQEGGSHGSDATDSWLLLRFSGFSWVTVSPFAVCSWDNFQRL